MVSITTVTYWCYVTSVLVQVGASIGFIVSPPLLVPWASDTFAQFFIRFTGISLLSLTQVFWGFRHIPFQSQGMVGSQLASFSQNCARLFTKFHLLMALVLYWIMFRVNTTIPNGQYLLAMHMSWACIMMYAIVMHQQLVCGYIIDTSSFYDAAISIKLLVQGEDIQEQHTVLQVIKGEDSSSKSVLQMFQDEIKTD